jgi:hypothetical protein
MAIVIDGGSRSPPVRVRLGSRASHLEANPHLWEEDTEESVTTSSRVETPIPSQVHPKTVSELSVGPHPNTPSSFSVKITSEDVAFAVLTKTGDELAADLQAVQIDQILQELLASKERRAKYTSLRGAEARKVLDALQLVSPSNVC